MKKWNQQLFRQIIQWKSPLIISRYPFHLATFFGFSPILFVFIYIHHYVYCRNCSSVHPSRKTRNLFFSHFPFAFFVFFLLRHYFEWNKKWKLDGKVYQIFNRTFSSEVCESLSLIVQINSRFSNKTESAGKIEENNWKVLQPEIPEIRREIFNSK